MRRDKFVQLVSSIAAFAVCFVAIVYAGINAGISLLLGIGVGLGIAILCYR